MAPTLMIAVVISLCRVVLNICCANVFSIDGKKFFFGFLDFLAGKFEVALSVCRPFSFDVWYIMKLNSLGLQR